uniref:Ig-like domain-containing protein n=1 Tax=Stegastes partitus TaxID=144197 RepID=A0A3B4ZMD4_9TELE
NDSLLPETPNTTSTRPVVPLASTGADRFYWYRQQPRKPPEFLIFHYGSQNESKAGLSATVSGDKNQITMKISSAAVTDSAVYYCAVRPTVTGNSKTLNKNLWNQRGGGGIQGGLSLPLGVRCQQLTAVKDEESSLEGSTVTLTCKYTKGSADYFFWYRQHPGKPPEFLISHSESGELLLNPVPGRSVTVKKQETQMDLKISSAAVTDSAVYYCAVRRPDTWSLGLVTIRSASGPALTRSE